MRFIGIAQVIAFRISVFNSLILQTLSRATHLGVAYFAKASVFRSKACQHYVLEGTYCLRVRLSHPASMSVATGKNIATGKLIHCAKPPVIVGPMK